MWRQKWTGSNTCWQLGNLTSDHQR